MTRRRGEPDDEVGRAMRMVAVVLASAALALGAMVLLAARGCWPG